MHTLCVCVCVVCVVCVCRVWCCAAEAHHATCAITGAKRRGSYAIERTAEPAGQTPGDPPSSGCTTNPQSGRLTNPKLMG